MDLSLAILLMIVLLLAKGFFSGSEIALVSADKIRLRHRAKQGNRGAQLAMELMKTPDILLSSTLVGTNVATTAITTLGTLIMIRLAGDQGDLWAMLLYAPLFLIFGEIVPKSIYQHKSDTLTPIIIYPLLWAGRLFYPVIFVFSRVARLAVRLVGGESKDQTISITREQLHTLVEMAEHGSAMSAFDRRSIQRVIRFADTTVAEAMIPLAEVTTISKTDSTSDAIALVRKRGYNRLPIFDGHHSNLTGIVLLTTWDLMIPDLADQPLMENEHPPLYVSPLQTIDKLLPILRAREDHMAIVVDEFGAAIGMITMEDIVEEVVGEIDVGYDFDEYVTRRKRTVEVVGGDVWLVDGRLSITETNEILGLQLQSLEFHTVGGLVMARLRRIPSEGDFVDESGYRFTVAEASARSVEKVRIERSDRLRPSEVPEPR